MERNTMNVVKGVGAGLAAGMLFGAVGSVMLKDSKKNKRKVAKAIDAVEGILDGIQDIFR